MAEAICPAQLASTESTEEDVRDTTTFRPGRGSDHLETMVDVDVSSERIAMNAQSGDETWEHEREAAADVPPGPQCSCVTRHSKERNMNLPGSWWARVENGDLASISGEAWRVCTRRWGPVATALAVMAVGLRVVGSAVVTSALHRGDGAIDRSPARDVKVGWILFVIQWLIVWMGVLIVWVAVMGSFFGAVRLARWREEIFAGSPVVAEATTRTESLSPKSCSTSSTSEAAPRPAEDRGENCEVGQGEVEDPVSQLFSGTAEPETEAVVFLTGATGLVGQMVLFDLLKHGAARRRLKRVFVMIRQDKKGVRARDRLEALKFTPMFRPLRESGAWVDTPNGSENGNSFRSAKEKNEEPSLKVPLHEASNSGTTECVSTSLTGVGQETARISRSGGAVVSAVEGDLAKEGLGLSEEDRSLLARAGITQALHCAASVKFCDPLAEAASTNVTGALRVAALVSSWPSCRSRVTPILTSFPTLLHCFIRVSPSSVLRFPSVDLFYSHLLVPWAIL